MGLQVWPKSGETTCRSKSVIDYLLAPVSRARYLLKDIHILPLEKKLDHNAIHFTLRRPRPLQDDPAEPSPSTTAACSGSEKPELPMRPPLVSTPNALESPPDKMGCEPTTPKSVIVSNNEWEATSNRSELPGFDGSEWGRRLREHGPCSDQVSKLSFPNGSN